MWTMPVHVRKSRMEAEDDAMEWFRPREGELVAHEPIKARVAAVCHFCDAIDLSDPNLQSN